jgi:hypothetical protein
VCSSDLGSNELSWRAAPADPWLKVSPASGTLSGGQSQPLTVTADRNMLPEGDGRTELRFTSTNGQGAGDVSVALREERPPAIVDPRASNTRIGGYGCPTTTEIRATITDESQPIHVVLIGPGGQTQVMKDAGSTYTGKLGSGSHASIVWRIIATDSRNNTATSPAQTVLYADCAARPVKPKPAPPQPAQPQPQPARSQPAQHRTGQPQSNQPQTDEPKSDNSARTNDNGSGNGDDNSSTGDTSSTGNTGSGSGDSNSGDSGAGDTGRDSGSSSTDGGDNN